MNINSFAIPQKWTDSLKHDSNFLNIDMSVEILEKFVDYTKNLLLWNKTYNLTAITNLEDIRVLHILDSLSIMNFIKGKSVLDVGTGAGFPGIPLALLLPNINFTLLDSNNKKIKFLNHIVRELKLKNVVTQHVRVENFNSPEFFDNIVTRATSNPIDIISSTQHLCQIQNGRWLFMRGKCSEQETLALRQFLNNDKINIKHRWNNISVKKLLIPRQELERNLIVVE